MAQVRVVIIAASEVRLGMTWAWIVLGLAWLGMLLLLFRWRLSRLLRTPRAELPHL